MLAGSIQGALRLFRYDDERATLTGLFLFTLGLVALGFSIVNIAYFELYVLALVELAFFVVALGAWLDLRINQCVLRSAWITVIAFGALTLSFYWLVGGAYNGAVWLMWFPPIALFLLGTGRGLGVYLAFLASVTFMIAAKADDWTAIADANSLSNIFGALLAVGLITYYQQMTKERAHRRIMDLANSDSLTGLANRRSLLTAANQAENEGRACALLLVDIDHFKRINDIHGHAAGDAALCEVARRLCAVVRRGDLVSRVGGEEFGVLLPDCEHEDARQLAERIRQEVAATPLCTERQRMLVTVTIGVASPQALVGSFDELFNLADQRLYQGKASGRDRVIAA